MTQRPYENRDIIGHRVLVGVQVVDISRLSTHPIPTVHGGLITVAGQGPSDSNGAGKSSWIAAISLLHADDQWRLASGAAGAAGLLFTAEAAGQEGDFTSIDRGYVIGVFSDPGAQSVDEIEEAAVTAWLRINRKASYLDLRWTAGLHIPYGLDESDRASSADSLWEQLPRSNGRQDFHANRLQDVLFGDRPRCMSFLSTSVRASKAANLLAEPLNELGPVRIFDAIAALTGLQTELEDERQYRKKEHEAQTRAREVEDDFTLWEEETSRQLAGIERRNRARELLQQANANLCSWYACRLIDGHQQDEILTSQIALQAQRITQTESDIAERKRQLEELGNGDALDEALAAAAKRLNKVSAEQRDLERSITQLETRIETSSTDARTRQREAETADGRDVETAVAEHEVAVEEHNLRIAEKAGADSAVEDARAALQRAEQGRAVAADALKILEPHVAAAALIDIVEIPDHERPVWEPRLTPYLEAVVVAADDADKAHRHLAGGDHARTILIHAHRRTGDTPMSGPPCTDDRFDLTRFFEALQTRATDTLIDSAAGASAVGDYSSAVTGRAARIAQARDLLEACLTQQETATDAHRSAKAAVDVAAERVKGAKAAVRARELRDLIEQLRGRLEELAAEKAKLAPELAAATSAHTDINVKVQFLEQSRNSITGELQALAEGKQTAESRSHDLTAARVALALEDRGKAWGDTLDAANQHILNQPDTHQTRTEHDWARAVVRTIEEALAEAFQRDDQKPDELEELISGRDGWKANPDVAWRVTAAPDIARALTAQLAMYAGTDSQAEQSISRARKEKNSELDSAKKATEEARYAAAALRNTTIQAVTSTLTTVQQHFNQLDQDYGGYGADLEWSQPAEPDTPDSPWEWAVIPRWRRTEGGPHSPFNVKGNTAQMDEKAVKLVCAAALAAGADRPLILILDELGRNLGSQHRREAVALFEQIGRGCNITVIGALQDDMERYAIASSKLYIKLRRRSDAMPYNEAPVITGDDENRNRVEILKDWLESYRGPRPTLESA